MGRQKRGATDLNIILAVDKPAGITSHDVVDRLRAVTGEGRIGHAGTLDPAATGLLLVCIGPATKLSEQLMGHDKCYEARIVFGSSTSTDDAEGEVLASAELPAGVGDVAFAQQLLQRFVGEQQQMPPAFSAIKKNGRRAYDLARKGQAVELEPRSVVVHSLELLGIGSGCWDVRAEVSKGTYLRALARDIGLAAGSLAHLGALRRTRIGRVSVSDAQTLEQLAAAGDLRQFALEQKLVLSGAGAVRPHVGDGNAGGAGGAGCTGGAGGAGCASGAGGQRIGACRAALPAHVLCEGADAWTDASICANAFKISDGRSTRGL